MPSPVAYLAQLRTPKMILWCYLIWYLVMTVFYFDGKPGLWINSLGLSAVIGTALVLSVLPPGGIRAMDKWALLRLFMMPLCVSSFAALIKDQGFVVVFSPRLSENLIAASACALFIVIASLCRVTRKGTPS